MVASDSASVELLGACTLTEARRPRARGWLHAQSFSVSLCVTYDETERRVPPGDVAASPIAGEVSPLGMLISISCCCLSRNSNTSCSKSSLRRDSSLSMVSSSELQQHRHCNLSKMMGRTWTAETFLKNKPAWPSPYTAHFRI